jgi:hypothetical protein
MSASSSQRFAVTVFDYGIWNIVLEASNEAEAIAKAKNIYSLDALGGTYAFDPLLGDMSWNARPLVSEVHR